MQTKIFEHWEGKTVFLEFRENEYSQSLNIDWVEFVSVFACDTTSEYDKPQLWDWHRAVIDSVMMPRDFFTHDASREEIQRYFDDADFRKEVDSFYE